MNIEEVFRRVYKILIEVGGASVSDLAHFVEFHVKRHSHDSPECAYTTEFRFMGHLGTGGKFWVDLDGFRVSYYPEDQTPELIERKATINRQLRPLFLHWHRLCEGGGVELTEEQRAEILEAGIDCGEWPACEEPATYFDEGDFAWCAAHGNK